jgi:hypothetical protein
MRRSHAAGPLVRILVAPRRAAAGTGAVGPHP